MDMKFSLDKTTQKPKIKTIIEAKHLIPSHQFGFKDKHFPIDQVHRIKNMEKNLEEKMFCSTIFLDVGIRMAKNCFIKKCILFLSSFSPT